MNGAFVGADEALGAGATEDAKPQEDYGDYRDGGDDRSAGISAHDLTPEVTEPDAGTGIASVLRSEPK